MNWAGKPYQRSLRTKFSQRQRTVARRRRLVLERLEERSLLAGDLYVTRLTPTGGTAHPFDTLEVQFSQPVVDGTLLLDDVSVIASGVPLATKGVTKLAADRYQVDLTGLTGLATYKLFDPSNNLLGTASHTVSGADVTLAGITLPADGTYHIKVQVPTAEANSTGNYVITAWNATVHVMPLNPNQTVAGNIDTPYRVDRWTSSANAGQVFNFNLVNAEDSSVQFDLAGPNGFTAFSNETASV